jgi:hypothetical protein
MANTKISELPQVVSLLPTDIVPLVTNSITSKVTVKNLADSLPIVSSSISASNASTASFIGRLNQSLIITGSALVTGSIIVTGSLSNGIMVQSVGQFSHAEGSGSIASGKASHAEGFGTNANGDYSHAQGHGSLALGVGSFASGVNTTAAADHQTIFGVSNLQTNDKYSFIIGNGDSNGFSPKNLFFASGSRVEVTGSLRVSGSSAIINAIGVEITGSVIVDTGGVAADYIYPVNYAGFNWRDPSISANKKPGFTHFYPSNTNSGNGNDGSFTYYFADVNFGQRMQSSRAGVLKFSRDFAAVPDTRIYTLVSDGLSTSDNNTSIFGYNLYNSQYHVLTVTGSFRSVDNTSLGTYIANKHVITGSVQITGSLTQNGFVVLTQVSQSLNFIDDSAAAAGGVPLGGLYRSGSIIAIRIS